MNESKVLTYDECLQRFMGNAKFGYAHIDLSWSVNSYLINCAMNRV